MATNYLNTNKSTFFNLGYLNDASYLSENVKQNLQDILITLPKNLHFKVEIDDSKLALEMLSFIEILCSLDSHLTYTSKGSNKACIKLYDEANHYLNIVFYTLPKGHLFSAFINVLMEASKSSSQKNMNSASKNIKVVVSSICIRSPQLVIHTSHMAFTDENTEVEIHDLLHSSELTKQYGVEEFPALIINHQLVILEKISHLKT